MNARSSLAQRARRFATTFNIDSTSSLDLTDNDLIDLYGTAATPYGTIKGDIVQAADGGKWDKTGLTGWLRGANAGKYGLGYSEASTLGLTSFDGVTLGGNAVLVKYTLLGDANLDGTVNFNDFFSESCKRILDRPATGRRVISTMTDR